MIERFYSRVETLERLRSGPLVSYIDGFVEALFNQGYSSATLKNKIWALGKLGTWLSEQQDSLPLLDEQRILEFKEYCREKQYLVKVQPPTLNQLLHYLRKAGVVPAERVGPDTRQPIEKEFKEYLVLERGLSPPAVRYSLNIAST